MTSYKRDVVLNYIFRALSIILGLFTVRLNLSYLGSSLYGLWVTIISMVQWMNYGDFGISNGLRNELAKAVGEDSIEKQNAIIYSATKVMCKMAIDLLCVFFVIIEILFMANLLDSSLRLPILITNIFFCLNFVLGASRSVAYAYQKSWLTSFTQCSNVVFSMLFIYILLVTKSEPNLNLFSVALGMAGVLANELLVLILHRQGVSVFSLGKKIKNLYDKKIVRSIFHIGIGFFILQLCGLILDSTDNLIINKIFGAEQVTKYSIITKVYGTGNNLFSILLISLWSAVTLMMVKGDFNWIGKQIKRLLGFSCIFGIGCIIISLFFNQIIKIWLGKNAIHFEPSLISVFCIYEFLCAFGSIYVNVANGLGYIKSQIISGVTGALFNIPLSIVFATTCGMGLLGIKLATLLCRFIPNCVVAVDVVLYLRKKCIVREMP